MKNRKIPKIHSILSVCIRRAPKVVLRSKNDFKTTSGDLLMHTDSVECIFEIFENLIFRFFFMIFLTFFIIFHGFSRICSLCHPPSNREMSTFFMIAAVTSREDISAVRRSWMVCLGIFIVYDVATFRSARLEHTKTKLSDRKLKMSTFFMILAESL